MTLHELPARMQALIAPCPVTGCWHWLGALDSSGYPVWWNGPLRRTVQAHRQIALWAFGPMDGLQVDHRCRVCCCVNPAHFDVVTHAENNRRAARARQAGWSTRQLRRILLAEPRAFSRVNRGRRCTS